ncbi:hypothetical protein GCM10009745_14490 [Kribbella yunnanensis]|uniref:Uncharacterized protein n=1 Tax=Kribbella yunnanensis TaxID=190194 RepID=A0ABP4SGU7_9ACTN
MSESVRSFDALMRLAAGTTVAMDKWAKSSRWTESSIDLAPERMQALREMFENPQSDPASLTRYRGALQSLLREHSRLLTRAGYDQERADAIADHTWAKVLDRGTSELWAAWNVDDFIDRLGLEQVVPGLKEAKADPEYTRETAAAVGYVGALATNWKWRTERIAEEIHRRPPHLKLEWASKLWYESQELGFLVPLHSQHVTILRSEQVVRDHLDRVGGVSGDDPVKVFAACQAHGEQAIRALDTELAAMRKEYDNPALMAFLKEDAKAAVLKITRAGQSAHNQALDETKSAGGIAAWDGRMHLHNKFVVQHLREMFANPGQQHDEQTLRRFRWAIGVVLHENAHFAIPDKDDYALSAAPFGDRKWLRWAEEGFVEAFNSAYLNDFIKETGLDKVAPGILEVESGETYESFAPAARAMSQGVDGRTGMDREALRRQAAASPRGQWDELVDQLYETSKLPDLVPDADVGFVKREIGEAMRTHFAWLDENTGRGNVQQTRELSALRGTQAFQAGVYAMESFEKLYGSPTAEALYQSRLARGVAPEATIQHEPGPVRERQWERAAADLYADSKLPGLVPEPEVFHVKRAIETAMGAEGAAEPAKSLITQLEAQYGSSDAKALYQSLLAAHSGVAPAGSAKPAQDAPAAAAVAARVAACRHDRGSETLR